ncbi:MAG: biopolymer transporter TolR [Reichenbachiella sp.]
MISTNTTSLHGQNVDLGMFDQNMDVGNPKLDGSTVYDALEQIYTMTGAGASVWAAEDQFQFVSKKIKGNFIMRATVQLVGESTGEHRKIGIMAREDLAKDAQYAGACVQGGQLTSLQYRDATAGQTSQLEISSYYPTEIALERRGNTFIFSSAIFGETYKSVEKELALNEELNVGLFISSHAEDVLEKVVFSNVRVVIPVDDDYTPYRDYIGSRLEIMDIETGKRKILVSQPNSMQAPNWTPDNQRLIWAEEGLLKYYSFKDGKVNTLNTGPATANNNDHVLSFDGKMMAISNHMGEDRISTIFTLPATGSDKPEQITKIENGHSFLHSWSPDGKKIVFTANRNDKWNIWEVNVETKEEYPLTDGEFLDDGSEYTPDGKYIYFNSVRTGTMQIWRMKPDGSEQMQITFDAYNDWFAHPSPDGKWIVYMSFPKDMDANSHPFYKKVYLRLMPAAGGVPKTIAYIYGGQGTINVPSWSPDSKSISFISNSKL